MVKIIKALFITIYVSGYIFRQALNNCDISELCGFKDELTQIPNRRYLKVYLNSNKAHYFVLLDLDYFKQVNDTRGHLAGDDLLRSMGKFLKELPGSPFCARYGGDEFLVLTPDLSSAIEIARYVKYNLYDRIGITCSIGVGPTFETADQQAYKSKAAGRNYYSY